MRVFWVFLLAGLFGCSSPWGQPASYSPGSLWTPSARTCGPDSGGESGPVLPDVLDVEKAVEIALSKNPGLENAFMRVEAARARLAASKSSFLPGLDGRIGYSNTFEVPQQRGVPGINQETELHSIGLRATWLLFDGLSREYRVKAASLGVEESRAWHDDARRLLKQAVEGALFDALGAIEGVRIAEADLAFQKELLEETTKRYNAGARSLSERLNFEVRVQTALTSLVQARSRLQILKVILAELLDLKGGSFPASVTLAALNDENAVELAAPEPQALVKEGLEHRPDLGASRAAVARTEAEVGVADGSWWPNLALVGEIGRMRFGNAHYRSQDTGSSISLDATWNLFSGGASLAGHREALADQRAAESALAETRNRIISEVLQAVEAVVTAQKQMTAQQEKLRLTRQTRDLVRKEYDAGHATLVRLNEAQRDYVISEAELASERVNLRIAWSRVRAATGR